MVEVTQEDRRSARDFAFKHGLGECVTDDLIQAFARHRIAAENAALERAAQIAEQTDTGWADARTFTAQKIAAAIRAMKGPSNG